VQKTSQKVFVGIEWRVLKIQLETPPGRSSLRSPDWRAGHLSWNDPFCTTSAYRNKQKHLRFSCTRRKRADI